MTRIIGGTAGGRRLKTPKGGATRPTSDRVREALFSSLESTLGTVAGLRFLDVYAGSGAVGLEARSRGAAAVVLVEHDRHAVAVIRANAESTGLSEIQVITRRAERLSDDAPPGGPFDVGFFDPPYTLDVDALRHIVSGLLAAGWFAADAVLVVERDRRDADWTWPSAGGVSALRSARYGETILWYGRRHA